MTTNLLTYTVSLFTSASKPTNQGDRLAVINWKDLGEKAAAKYLTDNGKAYKKPASRCVSIPALVVTPMESEEKNLAAFLTSAFQDMQDAVIRSIIEEQLAAVTDTTTTPVISFTEHAISYEGVAAFAVAKATSTRLTKEQVATWFDEACAAHLAAKITAKLVPADQTPDNHEAARILAATAEYKNRICSLSAPKPNYNEQVARELKAAISLADDTDGRTKTALLNKLEVLIQPQEVTLTSIL
jgi:hypothetical protein